MHLSTHQLNNVQHHKQTAHLHSNQCLNRCGSTRFDQQAILQNRYNSRATSNKMIYKTTDTKD